MPKLQSSQSSPANKADSDLLMEKYSKTPKISGKTQDIKEMEEEEEEEIKVPDQNDIAKVPFGPSSGLLDLDQSYSKVKQEEQKTPLGGLMADCSYQIQIQTKNVSVESQRSKLNMYEVDSNTEEDSNNNKNVTKGSRRSRAYTQS
jgi:cytochrome c1